METVIRSIKRDENINSHAPINIRRNIIIITIMITITIIIVIIIVIIMIMASTLTLTSFANRSASGTTSTSNARIIAYLPHMTQPPLPHCSGVGSLLWLSLEHDACAHDVQLVDGTNADGAHLQRGMSDSNLRDAVGV